MVNLLSIELHFNYSLQQGSYNLFKLFNFNFCYTHKMVVFLKRKRKDIKERKSQKVVRKYHRDYIKYNFIKAGNEFDPKA